MSTYNFSDVSFYFLDGAPFVNYEFLSYENPSTTVNGVENFRTFLSTRLRCTVQATLLDKLFHNSFGDAPLLKKKLFAQLRRRPFLEKELFLRYSSLSSFFNVFVHPKSSGPI